MPCGVLPPSSHWARPSLTSRSPWRSAMPCSTSDASSRRCWRRSSACSVQTKRSIPTAAAYAYIASLGGEKRQLALPHGLSRVTDRLTNILNLHVWVSGDDLVLIYAVSDHSNHRRHWKSQTTEAGDSAHLIRLHRASREAHRLRVPPDLPAELAPRGRQSRARSGRPPQGGGGRPRGG